MNLSDLAFVLRELRKPPANELTGAYKKLGRILSNASSKPTKELSQEVQVERNRISELHKNINLEDWSSERRHVFFGMGGGDVFGPRVLEVIGSIFEEHAMDPANAARRVQELQNQAQSLQNQIKQVFDGLGPLLTKLIADLDEPAEANVTIIFDGEAALSNLSDFREAGRTWHFIASQLATVAGVSSDEVVIARFAGGSTLLEIAAPLAVVVVFSRAIDAVLAKVHKWYEIRKLKREVENLDLENQALRKGLQQLAEEEKKDEYHEVAEKLVIESATELSPQERPELINGVSSALKKLSGFIKKGGRIDVDHDQIENEPNRREEFRLAYESIQRLSTEQAPRRMLETEHDKKTNGED